jgi:hypothetical protein
MATQLQKYKADLIKVISSSEFLDGMMAMMDEIRRNDNPDDVVTPFFSQTELLAIGDFYANTYVMGEITSCFINRTGKFLLTQAGLNVFEPNVLSKMIQIKDEIKLLETKTCEHYIDRCVKKYGQPKHINQAVLDELMTRMQIAEAQFEKNTGDGSLH